MAADTYGPLRDFAQQQLPRFEPELDMRNRYITFVIAWAALNGFDDDTGLMMAERIARYAWDSTPHKVIPHAHLKASDIPPGAKSPAPALNDFDRTVETARRLQAQGGAENAGAGQPTPGASQGRN